MCNILKTGLEPKEVTGYKVAIKRDNRYFSPSTNVEYTVGVGFEEPVWGTLTCEKVPSTIPRPSSKFYDFRHRGLTQIFHKKESAMKLKKALYGVIPSLEIVVLRCTGKRVGSSKIDLGSLFSKSWHRCYMLESFDSIVELG